MRYIITGVSNGIGAALAGILQEDGHHVIGLDIAEPSTDVGQFVQVDLSDPASVTAAVAQIEEPCDGLCNSAGLPPRTGLEAAILGVNFLGTRGLTRELAGKLIPEAAIVNLASRAGSHWRENVDQVKRLARCTTPQEVAAFVDAENIDPVRAYNLSKEAVVLWTIAASEAVAAQGGRINSVSPGAVETGIIGDFATAFGERMSRNVERAGRAGRPEEIAQLAAFLLSPASAWIKGTDIGIDGGMVAFNTSDALDLGGLA